jgi:hypothetical protein
MNGEKTWQDRAIAQTQGNLNLISQFIQELLKLPEEADPIPVGAAVVLLPPEPQGASELRKANVQMANDLVADGRVVVLWTVGGKDPRHREFFPVRGFRVGDSIFERVNPT